MFLKIAHTVYLRIRFIIVDLILFKEKNSMHKKNNLLIIGLALIMFSIGASTGLAQTNLENPEVVLIFFWGDGCPHCAEEKLFLETLVDKFPQLNIKTYEVYQNKENLSFLFALSDAMNFEARGVPVTIIGDQAWIGFSERIADEIEGTLKNCFITSCTDPVATYQIDDRATTMSPLNPEKTKWGFAIWAMAVFAVFSVLMICGIIIGKRIKATAKTPKRKKF